MSVAKIIELNAASKTGMEDAVRHGLQKRAESVKNIRGAWVNEIKVVTDDDGNVQEWRVNLRVTFIVNSSITAQVRERGMRATMRA